MAYRRDKIVLFFGTSDIYSQFHPCRFEIDGYVYNCAEQYMMHSKAVLFKDEEMAEKIIKETNPKTIKAYGRKVQNFNDNVWVASCKEVIYKGNLGKFSQNENLKNILLSTGDSLIAEASPFDRRYGIGLAKSNPLAQDPKSWRGKNWLGEAIMRVRKQLQEEKT